MSIQAVLALEPGAVFSGRYRVVRRIKAGGMGAVYEVVDDRTNGPRALKVMLPSMLEDPDLRTRFALEAKVTGNIASDHLVRVSDAGIDEPTQTPFLVMELLQGEELGSLLEKRRTLPPEEAVLYLRHAALALDKTHAAGIVHRDLKPENLFVTYRDDGSPCLKILDFGIAKVVAQSTARLTRAIGTPIYMSPEQIRGEPSIGHRSDLFALAHIAYTLLVGEAYWREEMTGADSVLPLLTKIVGGLPEAPSARARRRRGVALPPPFDAWMAKAAAGPQDDRFDWATTQVAALAEALGVAGPRTALPSMGMGTVPLPPHPSGTPSSPFAQRQPHAPATTPPISQQPFQPALPVSAASVPSLPDASSAALPAGTGVTVLSSPHLNRSRSMVPLVLGSVIVVALGVGAFVVMHARGATAAATAAAIPTVEPPHLVASPLPSATAAEPVVVSSVTPPETTPSATPTATATALSKSPPRGKIGAPPVAPLPHRPPTPPPSEPPRFSTPL